MRIIAGKFKGRRLSVPAGSTTRPTSDRARESLFNILTSPAYHAVLQDGRILDLFAGTGALGFEALSRGAASCHFYETDKLALSALRTSLKTLRTESSVQILSQDAYKPKPQSSAYSLIFTDPPYAAGAIEHSLKGLLAASSDTLQPEVQTLGPSSLSKPVLITKETLVVAQLDPKTEVNIQEQFVLQDDRRYGAARFLFLTLA